MDPISEWRDAQDRVIALVTEVDPATMESTVPACPDWSARNLLAHMIGVDADIVAGGEPDEYDENWTQRQVDARTDATVDELVSEWRSLTDGLTAWMDTNNANPLNDMIIHEQDLRGAIAHPGADDTPALVAIRDQLAEGFDDAVADLEPIRLRGENWQWTSHGGDVEPATVIEASDFDLARALSSRRSARQLREWTTRGDVTPYLEAFGSLGSLPDDDLDEQNPQPAR